MPSLPALAAFRERFRGRVVLPGDPGYDRARAVWNATADAHPALVTRCAGVDDVVAAVRFARGHELLVAVRGGGHSYPGFSTCDGGIVIDLSPMDRVEVDPARRVAAAAGGALLGELDRQAPTWVLDRWVAREHGLVVAGPDPRELIDPIGPAQLRAAVRASLTGHWALEGTGVAWVRPRNYQAFAVLSMCRDLYALEHGTLTSKPAAAAWASRRLGPPWPAQIQRALGWRSDQRVDDRALPETLAFVAHVAALADAGG